MVLITSNKSTQLLLITFIGDVTPSQFAEATKSLPSLLSDLKPGFSLLADLTPLRSMTEDCASQITDVMDLCDQSGVKRIIRVIPDPSKDIGLGILSRFHYTHKPRMILCESLAEAANHLRA
ncbi:MAG TPA: hypothetical protein VM680_07020 [Verrucomicrobiae bacterium]|nr:hypothetical protein [Verrucomicrobiae bacterium]